jgi:hypothetical protein
MCLRLSNVRAIAAHTYINFARCAAHGTNFRSSYVAVRQGDKMISESVSGICCSGRGLIVNVKRFGAGAAIVSAMAFATVGMGAGVASADQPLPSTPGMTWKLDHGHGNGRGGDWGWGDGGWNGGWNGGWQAPPAPCGAGYWVPPAVWQWVPPAA